MNDLVKQDDLEKRLLSSDDANEVQNIINAFNANIKKKDVLRALKISSLQDKITDEIDRRVSSRGGEFSNRDLLDYYKTLQTALDNTAYGGKDLSVPSIQINSNTINLDSTSSSLNRESRQKVFDAVQSLIAAHSMQTVDEDIEIDRERD